MGRVYLHHRQPQDHGRDDGHLVGLENVFGHPAKVAHVVTHQVGDDGRIARVVLGDASLDLAHQVGAHVSGLGIDAAAHAHEHGQQGATEAKAQQHLRGVVAVEQENRGAAQQPQPIGQHTGDGARTVSHPQCPPEGTPAGLIGHTRVPSRADHAQPDLPDGQRATGT